MKSHARIGLWPGGADLAGHPAGGDARPRWRAGCEKVRHRRCRFAPEAAGRGRTAIAPIWKRVCVSAGWLGAWYGRSCPTGLRDGTAALEFALASPLLIVALGGAADMGLAQYSRGALASAMLAGTEYANDTRPSPSSTTVAALVRAVASKGLDTNNLVVQVTGPSFTCVSGTSLVAPSSGTTCADGSSQTWYLQISATYTVAGLMSGFMSQATWTVSDSAIVCLQ